MFGDEELLRRGDGEAASVDRLVHLFTQGARTRRQFIQESLALGLSLSTIAGIMAACAPGAQSTSPSGTPRAGGTLNIAMSGDANGLDPALAGVGFSHLIIEQVFSTLTSLDANDQPHPDLATGWQISSDQLEYTFHLRPHVVFHNGHPLTADDVVFTFNRLRDPNTGYPFIDKVQTISRVVAIDPTTVKFTLSQPTAPFLVDLAFPGSGIVPNGSPVNGSLNSNPVGSGPYQFVSYQPGTLLTLRRNPQYYLAGRPYLDALNFHIIQDATARTNALLGGIVDFSSDVAAKDWKQVSATSNLVPRSIEGGHWHWLMLNNLVAPFTDVRVRKAVAYAIGRQALVDAILFGQATPILGGVIPKWNFAYDDKANIFSPEPDVSKAKALLAAAGHPNGVRVPMVLDASVTVYSDQGPLLQAQLAAAGIMTDLTLTPDPKYCNDVFVDHNFTISNQAWLSPLADPDDFITPNYQTGNPNNAQSYSNPKMDSLIATAKAGPAQAARKATYAQIEELANQDMPFVPTFNAKILMAHRSNLQGFVLPRSGFLKTIRDAWLSG